METDCKLYSKMCLKLEKVEWKVYTNSKIKKVIDESIKPTVVSLLGLASSKCWLQEIVIFFKVFKKLFILFKTCKLTRLMKQLKSQLNKFINCDLWLTLQMKPFVEEQFDVKTGYILLPTSQSLNLLDVQLRESNQFLEKILHFSLSSFEHSVLWLTLGHNLHHYCTALATIARINLFCKAFKVYICDLREGLSKMSDLPELSSGNLADISTTSLMTECTESELFSECNDLSSPIKHTSEEEVGIKKDLIESTSEATPEESPEKVVFEEKSVNDQQSECISVKRVNRRLNCKLKSKKKVHKVYKYVSSLKVLKLKF